MSSLVSSPKLCLVGAGNMGGAMLGGWVAAGHDPDAITVVDPNPPAAMLGILTKNRVTHVPAAADADRPDVIIVAVKPQIIDTVLAGLGHLVDENNVLLSVAAGATLGQLSRPFDDQGQKSIGVVRTIPNTPALIGLGMTGCVANDHVSDQQKQMVTSLLQAIGKVEWVDNEGLIDAITALSGSGPAYVFHLAEAMAEAGKSVGLPADLALRLAIGTIKGAGELLDQSDLPPEQLRKNVTSPNGTTAAALDVLMGEQGFVELMQKAVVAATDRSRELAG